jgi:hypothetical protein
MQFGLRNMNNLDLLLRLGSCVAWKQTRESRSSVVDLCFESPFDCDETELASSESGAQKGKRSEVNQNESK